MLFGVRFVLYPGPTLASVFYYVSVVEPTCEHQLAAQTLGTLSKCLFDVVFQSSYSCLLYY